MATSPTQHFLDRLSDSLDNHEHEHVLQPVSSGAFWLMWGLAGLLLVWHWWHANY